MRLRLGSSMTAAVAVVVAFAAPASAATLADWQMNEGAGATVMVDSSGHVNGTIGSDVVTGFKFQRGHRVPLALREPDRSLRLTRGASCRPAAPA